MTTARSITTYGGPKVDKEPVEDPTAELAADEYNLLAEDVAEMTGTTVRARVFFTPTATAAPTTLDPTTITVASHYGSGSGQKPTIAKTATGRYTLTWPASFTNPLNTVETVYFLDGWAAVRGATNGSARIDTIATNVVTIRVYDASGALADLTSNTVSVFLF